MPRKNNRLHEKSEDIISPLEDITKDVITAGHWPMSQSYPLGDEPKKDDPEDRLP